MRVGVACIYHESNTFVSPKTGIDAFQRQLLITGPDARRQFEWPHHEVMGFFDGLAEARIDAAPLIIASATPGGTITADALEALLARLRDQLHAAGKLDGVLVAPHGAAVSEKILDVDGHWLSLVREHVGPDVPIIGTFDPHANLSQKMVDATDALIAYRSNPHLDQYQRGREAASLMVRTLQNEIRPTQAAALPPMFINIERQLTTEAPCRDLYETADAMLKQAGVLSNSVVLGFRYADVPEMGSGFVVVTDDDRALAQKLADEMAAELWRRRAEFVGELVSVDRALDMALQSPPPVCLLDMGDNVGGGSPADGTVLAHAIHQRRIGPAFVCIADRESVQLAQSAGIGNRIALTMGGKTDEYHGPPLVANVTVLSLHDGKFIEPQIRHGGRSNFDMGPTAIVRDDTDLTIMLTTQRVFPASLVQLTSCGLDPGAFRILVAKGVHAPVAAYREVCKTMIRVNTPGVTTADLSTLQYHHRRRPLYPFER